MASKNKKSNKSASKSAPVKNKQKQEGGISNRKKLFYAAVSLWLVAMIVFLACYVKPNILDKQGPAVTGQFEEHTTPNPSYDSSGNIEYTEVEYSGTMMPDIFVDIIEAYEKERVSANELYGTVATVLGKDISNPEFVFRYHSLYSQLVEQAYTLISESGINKTGLDLNKTPANQTNASTGRSWAVTLSDNAISDLQREYVLFNAAVAAGTTLTREEVEAAVGEYMDIASVAAAAQKTPTEYFERLYTEGVSFSLIKLYIVMEHYIYAYQQDLVEKFEKNYPDDEVNAIFNADPDSFASVDVRILPIEDLSYDEMDAAKVVDEQTYFEFADKENSPYYTEYDHDADTKFFAVNEQFVSDTFGNTLSDWIFDSSRKPGEIKMIQGGLYPCMVYIIRPCYYTYSMTYRLLYVPFTDGVDASEEDMEATKTKAEEYYDKWKSGDQTEESFAALCKIYSDISGAAQDGGLFQDTRVGTVDLYLDEWCLKDGRKKDDVGIVETSSGYMIVYFIGENRDDPDWKYTYINNAAQADYDAECEKLYAKSGNEITQYTEQIANALLVCEQLSQRFVEINSSQQSAS